MFETDKPFQWLCSRDLLLRYFPVITQYMMNHIIVFLLKNPKPQANSHEALGSSWP